MARLVFLFTVVPALELFLLLQLGSLLGPLPTFLLIVVTGVVGAALARREGLGVLARLADEASRGLPPAERLVEGALIAAGGLLLVTPGVMTDLFGFALILPPTRRMLAPRVWTWLASRVTVVGADGAPVRPVRGRAADRPAADRPPPFDHPVA